jgi:hypothetical protein
MVLTVSPWRDGYLLTERPSQVLDLPIEIGQMTLLSFFIKRYTLGKSVFMRKMYLSDEGVFLHGRKGITTIGTSAQTHD